jgi:hypothetical protein
MPELTPKPDSTGGEKKKNFFLCCFFFKWLDTWHYLVHPMDQADNIDGKSR